MGKEWGACGRPTRRLRAALIASALLGALFAAPNALAGMWTVNSAADTDDGVCDVLNCTLREAIHAANTNAGADSITFDIGIGGSFVIQPSSALPDVTETTIIDATTQVGFAGAPLIQLDGSSAGSGVDGLSVSDTAATIEGLAIDGFSGRGIFFDGSTGGSVVRGNYIGIAPDGSTALANGDGVIVRSPGTTIGGSNPGDRNVVSGNTSRGIDIRVGSGNAVVGNYVGTDASGEFAVPNMFGMTVFSDGNTIGEGNVISGNSDLGMQISASNNIVSGNYVGTDADGTSAVPNQNEGIAVAGLGVMPAASSNQIGASNVISGNGGAGVTIAALTKPAQNNVVEGNLIGTDTSGAKPLGNGGPGVLIAQDSGVGNNTVGGATTGDGNTIAFNSQGIEAATGTSQNTFVRNSIRDNTGLGIELAAGANANLAAPALAGATRDGTGKVDVVGTYDGAASQTFGLDFYASEKCPAGSSNGETWIGAISVQTDGSGHVDFDSQALAYARPGWYITATATDSAGNTSAFSSCTQLPAAAAGTTLTVTTTADTGAGSLHDAIDAANALPGTDTIAFNLPDPSQPITPSETNPLPPILDDVVIDGNTQPGTTPGTPKVQIDGSSSFGDGLDINAGVDGSTIRGLSITGFFNRGISLDGPPSVVEGCYIGLEPDGVTAAPNGHGGFSDGGIELNSGNNRVGGTIAAQRNVISGNDGEGLDITNRPDNVVEGNYIGTNAAGNAAVPNTGDGIRFEDVSHQTIGGSAPGAGNLISGNGANGLFFNSGYEFTTGVIQGNTIGLAEDGKTPLPNGGDGIRAEGVGDDGVPIGGTVAGAGNVISGNHGNGITIDGSDGSRIRGNLIGTSADGLSGVPNASGGGAEVSIQDSSDVLVGGTTAAARNVISGGGSGAPGILISGGFGAGNNTIEGNYIGTNVNGDRALGNGDGILVDTGSAGNTIGGEVPGAANVISGNSTDGIHFNAAGTGNRVLGNLIGTDASGTSDDALGNDVGIELGGVGGTSQVQVGSTSSPRGGNVIAGSADIGILVRGGSAGNIFAGNFIGTDRGDTVDLGNGTGISFLDSDTSNNLIGPDNVIANNGGFGVGLDGGTGNRISANSIHDNGNAGIHLAPGGVNNGQESPTIATATLSGSTTTISGTLSSAPSTTYFVEYFATPSCTGQPQGQTYLGPQTVTTDGSGDATLSRTSTFPALGDAITATATNASTGDTSEFSACQTVTAAETPQPGPTYTVNTADDHDDGTCGNVDCTLREAINAADAAPGSAIHFDLPAGQTTITPASNLPLITVPTTIDATTQPGFVGTPLVTLDGSGVSSFGNGFHLDGDGSTIRGFVITGWNNAGIDLSDSNGNTIAGNYIGIDVGGIGAQNGDGILLDSDSDNNTIGGTAPNDRNVISANGRYGIELADGETGSPDSNTIAGNYIGLKPDGTGVSGVSGNVFSGISVSGDSNTIGGTTETSRNYISGNDDSGIFLIGQGNSVKRNTIGLDVGGHAVANNGNGIDIEPNSAAPQPNVIGDLLGNGNVISANFEDGIFVSSVDGSSQSATIQGNLIGTNPTGTTALGNGLAGIETNDASFNQIDHNTLSGNLGDGYYSFGFDSHDNVLAQNMIGTNSAGTAALPNHESGIQFDEAAGTVDHNVISANTQAGVEIDGPEPPGETHTQVTANKIGTNAAGTQALANGSGVHVTGSNGDTIGTTSAPNVISGNLGPGVVLDSASAAPNVVEGNFIGTDSGGTLNLGNAGAGVQVVNGASGNIVRRNTITHNGGTGVRIAQPSLHTNVTANSIDLNTGLGIDLGTTGITPNDNPDSDGFQNFPSITGVTPTSISGSLASAGGQTYNIDLYRSPVCDPSGNGEGGTYLGTTTTTTNAGGTGTFTANVPSLPSGQFVTATATSPGGDTSEFSPCAPTVQPPIATNLSLTPSVPSVSAGAPRVKLSDVPPSALIAPILSQLATPVNQTPVNQTPINQLATSQAPVNQTPINQTPVNQTPVNQSGFAELTQSISQLGSIPLSTIPLVRTGGWDALLVGTPIAGIPLQNVTLRDLYALNPLPVPLRANATNPLTIGDLDLSRSSLGTLPAMVFALGKLPLSQIPTSTGSTSYTGWCSSASSTVPGIDCGSSATVLSAGLQGAPVNQTPVNQTPVNQTLIQALKTFGAPVNQTPVNQTPVNQTRIGALPVNQTPVNQTPVNQTPVNQLSLQGILAANAPVNQTPVNQTPVNQLNDPSLIVDCTKVNCATATLGDAYAAGAIRPGVTLGDLRRDAPASLLALWTIADLRFYDGMTIGDLLASLPQPNDFTLADVLILVLGSPSGQGLGFESINIFDTGLPNVATGGSTVGYRARFSVGANGGPSNVPSPVTVTTTLASGFQYVAGSSKLVQSPSDCTAAGTPIANPASNTLSDGRLRLTWTVNTTVGNAYSVCFTARPGILLGPQAASLDATPGGGTTASAAGTPVNVGDTLEANNDASTAPVISNDSFYLSYLTSATDVDYYRFPAPPAGTVVTFHLSHLPADDDLVVYGPPETQLRPSLASGVPLDEPPVTDAGVAATHATDSLPSQTLDDLRLQTGLPLVGVSASRGTDPEDVVAISPGGTGFYTVQVTGYNGATSPDPYMLRVETQPPRVTSTVGARSITGTVGPALPALPTGLNTVFVVNRQQLEGIYGSTAATNVMNTLSSDSAAFTKLGFPNVVLSVDRFSNVQSAYAAWNANPGSPAAADAVVQAINSAVDTAIRSQPGGAGVRYVVLVGGDQVIPFARLDDFTVTASNEAGYASTFGANTDLAATLNAGQMLSDDPYGSTSPVPYLTRQLYIPNLSVGRLVETPADIIRTLNNFVSPTVNGHLDPTSSLTTGYDFLFDGASAVNSALAGRVGAGNARALLDNPAVIGDSWTLAQLTGALLPTTGSAPTIASLNGHASHYQFQPPNNDSTGARSALFTTDALSGSSTSLANRLVFSMGCHAGLSVADSEVLAAGASTLDWPQAYAQKGVGAYLGNTGYGYGDTLVVAYSEELNRLFAQRIASGSTVGDALAAAKQAYFAETGVFGVYDEKAMAEFTDYGLPMWSVSAPAGAGGAATQQLAGADALAAPQTQAPAAPAASAASNGVITDQATGLDAETFSVDPANTPHMTSSGKYWSGPDGVQVTQLRPIQPKQLVSLSGATEHGALLTELSSSDQDCIDPVFARPVVDLSGNEPELPFGDVAFPSKLQTVRTIDTPGGRTQQLVLVTGQFFSRQCATNSDPQVGAQRLFGHVAGRVFRSTSTDYIPPAFQLINATQVGANAAFSVDVTDQTPTGAGQVKEVVVGVRSGTQSAWTFVNLAQSASNPTRWTGGVPVSGTNQFEYFAQAVDASGNVAVSTNKGFYFVGTPTPPPTGNINATLTGTKVNSWFAGSPALAITAPPGVTVQASIDGGPFGTPPTSISGDGVHTIDVRASNGGTASLVAPIDTTAPTLTLSTPANGAQYARGSVVKADYFCSDSGSGVASGCVGTVPRGANIDTSCASATCTKTFTVSAPTDVAGHTGTARSVTYTVVVRRKILFSSARTTSGDIYVMNPDGSGVVQLTSTAGNDEQPAWSPDGTRIAFASARSGSNGLDIYVMDAFGGNVKRLTTAPGDDTAPAWSTDGTKIAFQSLRDGNTEIYSMNADGSNQTRLTNSPNQDLTPSWSPDGTKIAFASNRNGGQNIWVMDANGANPKQLTFTNKPEGNPAWKPDGSLIVFSSKRNDIGTTGTAADIYTMTPSGGSVTTLTSAKGDDTEPIWSRDGQFIAFTSLRDGNQNVYTMTPSGGSPTRLTTYSGFDGNPDW